jgi:hypothetical protein
MPIGENLGVKVFLLAGDGIRISTYLALLVVKVTDAADVAKVQTVTRVTASKGLPDVSITWMVGLSRS